MATTDADRMDVIEALMKMRRREAHGRLKFWAENRERISGVGSLLGRVLEMQENAGVRSVPDRSACNSIERACDTIETALRVERYVRMMPREWRVLVAGLYLEGKTQADMAAQLGIERNRVVCRLQDVQDRVACEWESQRVQEMLGDAGRLTSACKPVDSAHAAKLRPAA
jgi:hypothetical protein